jgi:hypothetical protein
MTMREMSKWTRRLLDILNSDTPTDLKDQRLANLMSDMEEAYQIPVLDREKRKQFEKQNPFVMAMYNAVAEARA